MWGRPSFSTSAFTQGVGAFMGAVEVFTVAVVAEALTAAVIGSFAGMPLKTLPGSINSLIYEKLSHEKCPMQFDLNGAIKSSAG